MKVEESILIEAIQMHPCLFDKSIAGYKNKLVKERAWMAVAAATGSNVELCQGRWRSLRDRYVKESVKAPSGSAANEIGSWKYLEAMSFLKKHVAPRRTFSNTSFSNTETQPQVQPQVQPELNTQHINIGVSEPLFDIVEEDVFEPSIFAQSSPIDHNKEEPTPSTSRQAKRKRDEDRLDNLCGAVSGWLQRQETTPTPVSRNADFLKMLDSYLLKHPEEDQDRMKIEILSFVFNSGKSS